MPDPNLGQAIASAWNKKIGGKPSDNIFKSRALFYLLGKSGFKEEAEGGNQFEFTIEYATNANFKSYSETDTLDTNLPTVFDAATYTPKLHAGTVAWTELEKLRTAGASGKFDLIAEKMENGKDSLIASLNTALFGDGTGNSGKDIDGLAKVIAADPTTGVVGGINRATYSFWRNQQLSGAKSSTAFDNLRSAMRTVYNLCSVGGVQDAPTAFITDRATFEGYESLLTAVERYAKDGSKAPGGNAGFDNNALFFKGAKGLYDEECTAGYLYFINPKFLKLVYYKGGWLKMNPTIEPANQLTYVSKVFTFAQLCTSNPRRLGVVTGIN